MKLLFVLDISGKIKCIKKIIQYFYLSLIIDLLKQNNFYLKKFYNSIIF